MESDLTLDALSIHPPFLSLNAHMTIVGSPNTPIGHSTINLTQNLMISTHLYLDVLAHFSLKGVLIKCVYWFILASYLSNFVDFFIKI